MYVYHSTYMRISNILSVMFYYKTNNIIVCFIGNNYTKNDYTG